MTSFSIEDVLSAQKLWQGLQDNDARTSQAAFESLSICSDAVHTLAFNLKSIGYEWASISQIPAAVVEQNVALIEKAIHAKVPPVLTLYWKVVGGIAFVDLEYYRHVDFWNEHKLVGPKYFCDGLYIDICNDEWTSFVCSDYEDWVEFHDPDLENEFLLSLSPDGFHKDNISGGDSYGLYGGNTWKPPWQNFEWSGAHSPITSLGDPLDFLSYLRTTILECAGFPGLLGSPGFNRIRERLLQGMPVF